jgi:hypothetical protein
VWVHDAQTWRLRMRFCEKWGGGNLRLGVAWRIADTGVEVTAKVIFLWRVVTHCPRLKSPIRLVS